MNSPEISLDMNLGSPSIADGIGGSGDGGEGMDRDENNTLTISGIARQGHCQHYNEENYQKKNYTRNNDSMGQSMNHSSHESGIGNSGINVEHSSSSTSNDMMSHCESNKKTVKKIDCDEMTTMFEDWKDELLMMRVKNAIVLDDLVKVGASV